MYNIVVLLGSFGGGGIERAVLNFLSNVDSQKFNFHIICFKKCGILEKDFDRLDIPIYEVVLHSWNIFYVIFLVLRYVVENKIDLIHSHSYHADVVSRIVASIAHINVVNTMHTNSSWKRRPKSMMSYFRCFVDSFTAKKFGMGFIALTESIYHFYVNKMEYPNRFWKIISNPLNFSRMHSTLVERNIVRKNLHLSGEKILIVAVGNLLRIKGHRYLLEAIHLLDRNTQNKCKFIICGEGRERKALEELIRLYKINNCVELLGYRDDIGSILSASDIFVMPSLSEGESLAILEAMSLHLPLIVTSEGGHTDFLSHQKNALIVSPGCSVELKSSLEYLIKNKDERIRLGDYAFASFNAIPIRDSIEKQLTFYSDLIENNVN